MKAILLAIVFCLFCVACTQEPEYPPTPVIVGDIQLAWVVTGEHIVDGSIEVEEVEADITVSHEMETTVRPANPCPDCQITSVRVEVPEGFSVKILWIWEVTDTDGLMVKGSAGIERFNPGSLESFDLSNPCQVDEDYPMESCEISDIRLTFTPKQ